MVDDCIFCKMVSKEVLVKILYENDDFLVFPDASPATEGHTLIIPKKHFVNTVDMPENLGNKLVQVIKKVWDMKKREGFDGFNILQNNFSSAGQVVMHAHFHILPRRKGNGKSWRLI